MLEIRVAFKEEMQDVRSFYHTLIDDMEGAQYHPGWKKDIYPDDEYLQSSIEKQELIVGLVDGRIAAAMIVNHDYNESYERVDWPTDAKREEMTVIHTLGVGLAHSRKGFAHRMVEYAITQAIQNHQKVVRLDVLKGNLPAERLYTRIGFRYVDTLQMFYEDTGWTEFELYEYPLT